MILRYIPPHLRRLILAAAVGAGLQAGEKFDLDRITPVPASETIPVQDFFRPSLFYGPQLNPSGTRLSALVSAAEDRDRLIVYELDSKKMETVYGSGDRDIYAPVWLDDNRLVFSLAKEKHLGEGILRRMWAVWIEAFPWFSFAQSTWSASRKRIVSGRCTGFGMICLTGRIGACTPSIPRSIREG